MLVFVEDAAEAVASADVTVGVGRFLDRRVPWWTEFLRALAEVNSDMAVNIEHEDASYSGTDGLAIAASTVHAAVAEIEPHCRT